MDEFETLAHISNDLWPLLIAIGCGGVIGLERETRGKPAGIRTNMLICFGAAAFVQLGAMLSGSVADPTRVLGQVIVGIGFLGAGSIIVNGGHVVGLTTAATIWVSAAVGSALGLGFYIRGIAWTILCVFVLQGIGFIERKIWNGHNGQGPHGYTRQ